DLVLVRPAGVERWRVELAEGSCAVDECVIDRQLRVLLRQRHSNPRADFEQSRSAGGLVQLLALQRIAERTAFESDHESDCREEPPEGCHQNRSLEYTQWPLEMSIPTSPHGPGLLRTPVGRQP